MKKFFKKNKMKVMLITIAAAILLFVIITLYLLFFSSKGGKYGNRLDDVKKVEISNKTVTKIKDSLKESDYITEVEYHLEGKLINILVTVNADADRNSVVNDSSKILDSLSDKVKKAYDVQVLVDSKEESENYPIIGYKHKTSDNFVWSKF